MDIATHRDASAPRGVRVEDALAPQDPSAGWEVWPLNTTTDDIAVLVELVLHELHELDLGVVHDADDRIEDLCRVMRRETRRHSHRDAHPAVDQQVRELARQHGRLEESIVVVGREVHRVELDVLHHVDRGSGHPRFGVSHRRGRVTVDRTEVPLRIDNGGVHFPLLRHAHHGRVDDGLAVRVVVP